MLRRGYSKILLFSTVDEQDPSTYGITRDGYGLEIGGGSEVGPAVQINDGRARLNVSLGAPVKLNCSTSGLRNSRVRWSRAGGEDLPAEHSVRNGVLRINRVQPDDAGEYICTVSSRQLEFDLTKSIHVIIKGKLTIFLN